MEYVQELKSFSSSAVRLIQRCSKPDAREFKRVTLACMVGFAIMGFIGYFVKLVFIPINNILIGAGSHPAAGK